MPLIRASQLAVAAVSVLISFLAYGSQLFFKSTEPYSIGLKQAVIFNLIVLCTWICYSRACFTDPGCVSLDKSSDSSKTLAYEGEEMQRRYRWCRKCGNKTPKAPRSHHCKICQRCIPKMDHHCPWTSNCVSHRTFPHFFRFLFYSVVSMVNLEYFLYIRVATIWDRRDLPSHLGPSPAQIMWLFVFVMVNSIMLFALSILLIRSTWSLVVNVTTIEGWEIERHETLLRRARVSGGYLDGPDGIKVKIVRQEFPYDIGFIRNIRQGLGGGVFLWLWPFAITPSNQSGLQFETNGFEDSSVSWPPPDPDRIPRRRREPDETQGFTYDSSMLSDHNYVKAFHQRQSKDLKRFGQGISPAVRRNHFHERQETLKHGCEDGDNHSSVSTGILGSEPWRDLDGDTLDDFGVDENAEIWEGEEVTLSSLLKDERM